MRPHLDLWPSGIENQRVSSPVTILKEQAYLLGEKTKNLVQAEIFDEEERQGMSFSFRFFLVAPVVGNYHYKLLSIQHDISLYPVEITVEDSILSEIRRSFPVRSYDDRGEYEYIFAETEEKFIEVLRGIFNSTKARQVLTALLSQSDPDWAGSIDVNSRNDNPKAEDIPF